MQPSRPATYSTSYDWHSIRSLSLHNNNFQSPTHSCGPISFSTCSFGWLVMRERRYVASEAWGKVESSLFDVELTNIPPSRVANLAPA